MRAVRPDESADDHPAATPHRASGRLPSGFATLRDLLSFIAGIAIVTNEVFISPTVELYSVGAGLALMGLPIVFGADERKSR